ncbi:hypothetical protein Pmar_PMAR019835 [Perkinsus marinus ATCC 50983]|uniref:C2H2-type domain-containing protein n=1 Tax=Perkinsus marinus (strain ATCC 50983 / TXsc) TaxID=423536 RepID=C5KBS2_PERM5|nr:hypothetical protein Pmar_PMAR019835 [Perkinsus marinus ATCC 50983]EER17953.1 hypothetical protein Pmar_PMAR019835 [Perkinsus marinus ATCC 50983]|eukprot:XP_002786157.1 hypothetical protein Pmar_PMAR019835 [Perkinsus marinus ATCC 50983]
MTTDIFYCEVCKRVFVTLQQVQQHVQNQIHIQKLNQMDVSNEQPSMRILPFDNKIKEEEKEEEKQQEGYGWYLEKAPWNIRKMFTIDDHGYKCNMSENKHGGNEALDILINGWINTGRLRLSTPEGLIHWKRNKGKLCRLILDTAKELNDGVRNGTVDVNLQVRNDNDIVVFEKFVNSVDNHTDNVADDIRDYKNDDDEHDDDNNKCDDDNDKRNNDQKNDCFLYIIRNFK